MNAPIPDQADSIEALLLELVHDVSSIRAGKTFSPTDYTKPILERIEAICNKQVVGELEKVHAVFNSPEMNHQDVRFDKWLDDRIAELAPQPHTGKEEA